MLIAMKGKETTSINFGDSVYDLYDGMLLYVGRATSLKDFMKYESPGIGAGFSMLPYQTLKEKDSE